jgi:WhiB family redox-sensing transcriptional regulator
MNRWRDKAACLGHDPELWHATILDGAEDVAQAKAICATCQVTQTCLQEVLATEGMTGGRYRYGVRGGLDGDERAGLGKPRRGTPPPCGTAAGYRRHQRLGEPRDEACVQAYSEYRYGQRVAS